MSHAEHKDYAGAKLGMWLFLFTELLLFGGLFLLYAVYLKRYPQEFSTAGRQLNWVMGTANTVILLTSSLCAAMAVSAVQRAEQRRTLGLIAPLVFSGYFELPVGMVLCALLALHVRRTSTSTRHLAKLALVGFAGFLVCMKVFSFASGKRATRG